VSVAQRGVTHISQPDATFAAAVREHVAVRRVELGAGDYLCVCVVKMA
jgi:hypothetical protein